MRHLQFSGKVRAANADMVKNVAKISIYSKMDEVDDDTLDHLAELCAIEIGIHAHLEAEGHDPVDLDCWVPSIKGDFGTKTLAVVLQIQKSEITSSVEAILVQWCRMEKDVLVEISNRQMSFDDLKTAFKSPKIDSVTMTTPNGRTVELK